MANLSKLARAECPACGHSLLVPENMFDGEIATCPHCLADVQNIKSSETGNILVKYDGEYHNRFLPSLRCCCRQDNKRVQPQSAARQANILQCSLCYDLWQSKS